MRTTIRIDDALYRDVKAAAARSGRTVAAVIEDAVRRGLHVATAPPKTRYTVEPIGRGGVRSGVDISSGAALVEIQDQDADLHALR